MSGEWIARRRAVAVSMLAGVLVALACTPPASARAWRCNGERALCDRPFNEVVLAATHNSMSAASLGWQIPNQQTGIPEQLRAGVRGLLIDTYYAHREPNGTVVIDQVPTAASELYLCHVACQLGATKLVAALRAIRIWVRRHPNNVLLIVNEDYTRPEDFAREVRRSGLARHVYRGRTGPTWPTLGRMIRRGGKVVMLSQGDTGSVPWYHDGYAGILQETAYTWPTPELITDPARWPASCRPNRGDRTGTLFLMNHWSPPVAPNPLTSAVVNAAGTLVGRANACREERGLTPTLVAVDMYESGGLIAAVEWLNAAPRPRPAPSPRP